MGVTAEASEGEKAAALVGELRRSYRSGKTTSYEWRVRQLRGVLRMIEEREQEVMDALFQDLGKAQTEAYLQEVILSKDACKFAIKNLKSWMKSEKVWTPLALFPSSGEIVAEPYGVVLVISAWNYPFLIAIDPVIGAIAAGNAVVLKPSEISPATSSFFARRLPEYVDGEFVRVVEGGVAEATALLEQKWDKIFFTGSGRVGRIVMVAAAKHLTPVVLELGGKSPVVVDSDVDLEVAARRIVAGKWGCYNGQACVAPDYVVTTRTVAPKLVEALKDTLEKFFGKDPTTSKDLSKIVNSKHYTRLSNLMDEDGVCDKIVYGGQGDEKSRQISPTIILDVPLDSSIMKEEIFGPLLPIVLVDRIEESFDIISSVGKPLAAYLFTNDKDLQKRFVKSIPAGGMAINETALHMAVLHFPFGGIGESGNGSYHGKFSFDTFSHRKGVLCRTFGGEFPARYPPFTLKKQKILRALLEGDYLRLILVLLGIS